MLMPVSDDMVSAAARALAYILPLHPPEVRSDCPEQIKKPFQAISGAATERFCAIVRGQLLR